MSLAFLLVLVLVWKKCVYVRLGVRVGSFFFFRQKTAYEMRISDWSSDVCSSDLPSKPFGGMDDVAWAPDGKSLVVSARLSNGEEPRSTNFDLYRLQADGSGTARNLTTANPAWDAGPVFSADGNTLYYRAMKRPGFEADRFALMAMDLGSGATREIDPQWDRSADGIVLSADGRTIYTTAQRTEEHTSELESLM